MARKNKGCVHYLMYRKNANGIWTLERSITPRIFAQVKNMTWHATQFRRVEH